METRAPAVIAVQVLVDDSGSGSDTGTGGSTGDEPTAVGLTDLMGVGWNAGNTLDAIGGETAWGNPKTDAKNV
ncbi:hypothetical protein P4S72_07355 [Vibrio sp. PP-XX7]